MAEDDCAVLVLQVLIRPHCAAADRRDVPGSDASGRAGLARGWRAVLFVRLLGHYIWDMNPNGYQCGIDQCDVPQERRGALEAYRTKRDQWLAWLDTDKHHAIWHAISAMVWTDVSFRTIAKFAADDSCLSNTLLAEQIIHGYVATQVLAVRRLVDNRADVISLRRLIKDLRRNFELFTRENYVCYDGQPYDYETAMQKEIAAHAGEAVFWCATGLICKATSVDSSALSSSVTGWVCRATASVRSANFSDCSDTGLPSRAGSISPRFGEKRLRL
jgi:hypothetical protein